MPSYLKFSASCALLLLLLSLLSFLAHPTNTVAAASPRDRRRNKDGGGPRPRVASTAAAATTNRDTDATAPPHTAAAALTQLAERVLSPVWGATSFTLYSASDGSSVCASAVALPAALPLSFASLDSQFGILYPAPNTTEGGAGDDDGGEEGQVQAPPLTPVGFLRPELGCFGADAALASCEAGRITPTPAGGDSQPPTCRAASDQLLSYSSFSSSSTSSAAAAEGMRRYLQEIHPARVLLRRALLGPTDTNATVHSAAATAAAAAGSPLVPVSDTESAASALDAALTGALLQEHVPALEHRWALLLPLAAATLSGAAATSPTQASGSPFSSSSSSASTALPASCAVPALLQAWLADPARVSPPSTEEVTLLLTETVLGVLRGSATSSPDVPRVYCAAVSYLLAAVWRDDAAALAAARTRPAGWCPAAADAAAADADEAGSISGAPAAVALSTPPWARLFLEAPTWAPTPPAFLTCSAANASSSSSMPRDARTSAGSSTAAWEAMQRAVDAAWPAGEPWDCLRPFFALDSISANGGFTNASLSAPFQCVYPDTLPGGSGTVAPRASDTWDMQRPADEEEEVEEGGVRRLQRRYGGVTLYALRNAPNGRWSSSSPLLLPRRGGGGSEGSGAAAAACGAGEPTPPRGGDASSALCSAGDFLSGEGCRRCGDPCDGDQQRYVYCPGDDLMHLCLWRPAGAVFSNRTSSWRAGNTNANCSSECVSGYAIPTSGGCVMRPGVYYRSATADTAACVPLSAAFLAGAPPPTPVGSGLPDAPRSCIAAAPQRWWGFIPRATAVSPALNAAAAATHGFNWTVRAALNVTEVRAAHAAAWPARGQATTAAPAGSAGGDPLPGLPVPVVTGGLGVAHELVSLSDVDDSRRTVRLFLLTELNASRPGELRCLLLLNASGAARYAPASATPTVAGYFYSDATVLPVPPPGEEEAGAAGLLEVTAAAVLDPGYGVVSLTLNGRRTAIPVAVVGPPPSAVTQPREQLLRLGGWTAAYDSDYQAIVRDPYDRFRYFQVPLFFAFVPGEVRSFAYSLPQPPAGDGAGDTEEPPPPPLRTAPTHQPVSVSASGVNGLLGAVFPAPSAYQALLSATAASPATLGGLCRPGTAGAAAACAEVCAPGAATRYTNWTSSCACAPGLLPLPESAGGDYTCVSGGAAAAALSLTPALPHADEDGTLVVPVDTAVGTPLFYVGGGEGAGIGGNSAAAAVHLECSLGLTAAALRAGGAVTLARVSPLGQERCRLRVTQETTANTSSTAAAGDDTSSSVPAAATLSSPWVSFRVSMRPPPPVARATTTAAPGDPGTVAISLGPSGVLPASSLAALLGSGGAGAGDGVATDAGAVLRAQPLHLARATAAQAYARVTRCCGPNASSASSCGDAPAQTTAVADGATVVFGDPGAGAGSCAYEVQTRAAAGGFAPSPVTRLTTSATGDDGSGKSSSDEGGSSSSGGGGEGGRSSGSSNEEGGDGGVSGADDRSDRSHDRETSSSGSSSGSGSGDDGGGAGAAAEETVNALAPLTKVYAPIIAAAAALLSGLFMAWWYYFNSGKPSAAVAASLAAAAGRPGGSTEAAATTTATPALTAAAGGGQPPTGW